jgi:hypothetical protein
MNLRGDNPLQQGPISGLAELQVVKFIVDALRSGKRAILVTGRGQVPARAHEAAFARASVRTLHIRPPLPEPPELQERIGAALGVEGCRDLAPLAMTARLLYADPKQKVIVAIDEAHTLSHRSLSYLKLMTDLLEPDEPVLQIVLAAAPALLDTLAQPEFESFRNRLCRPDFETFLSFQDGEANTVLSGSPPCEEIFAARAQNVGQTPAPSQFRIARFAACSVATIAVLGCLAAIGYVAFPDFSADPTWPPASPDAVAPQRVLTPSDLPQPPAQPNSRQAGETADPLVDDLAEAVASGSVELVSTLLEGIVDLERSASPDGLKLVTALPGRIAARARAAAAAGRMDEMRRLDRVDRLLAGVGPDLLATADSSSIQSFVLAELGPSGARPVDEPPRQRDIAQRPESPPDGSAFSPLGASGDGDRPASSPNTAASAAPNAATDSNAEPPQMQVKTAPTAREGPPEHAAGQLGASSDGDRAVSTPNAAAPAIPNAATDSSPEVAPPQMQHRTAVREGPPEHAAEQLSPSRDGDRAASPRTAAAPAASGAATDQNVDVASRNVLASTAPTADESPAAQVVPVLPALAPVRVVLDVTRSGMGRAGRAADIRQALVAAGLKVAELVRADAQQPAPRIGYYFRSDRDAAADVSRLLEPLLGAVDPVGLRMRGAIAEPGTIEVAIP